MASSSNKSASNKPAQRRNSEKRVSGRTVSTKRLEDKITDDIQTEQDRELFHEIGLIALFIVMLLLFFCNFGIIGPAGNTIRDIMFGIFGFPAYVTPVLIFLATAFWFANEGSPTALRKLIAGIVLFIMIGIVCELVSGSVTSMESYQIKEIYDNCSQGRRGGGVLSGSIAYLMQHSLETVGTVLVVLLCSAISIILLTERSLLGSVKDGSERFRELSSIDPETKRENAERRREAARLRREEQERIRAEREEERRLRAEEKENEKILRMEKKVSGVTADTALKKDENRKRDDIHEITYQESDNIKNGTRSEHTDTIRPGEDTEGIPAFDFDKIRIRSAHQVNISEYEEETYEDSYSIQEENEPANNNDMYEYGIGRGASSKSGTEREMIYEPEAKADARPKADVRPKAEPPVGKDTVDGQIHKDIVKAEKKSVKKYVFPPISRLQKGQASGGDSSKELKETAMRLQSTLNTFGVRVSITDISQGPSVTRYELQPEQGVKVSKIVGLADDIKLNLAATDIRIEAPIPGKAAIGIEVPNKENMMVALRDLFESKEFKDFPSNIAFAVGKDIAGKTVVADIAKMPHMLIAGATGSGKSVCINTLIMSILYKAHPDDVKLIMIDPKVVELSVYNGIPHLLIPVVTDPKKASAALHWAVSEMEDRYRKFADLNVRDLKGYNKKIEGMDENSEEASGKLPQIVIIVDELADLMMVSPGEVEESICRLAQLARACGIHLIIATQRPSVDVITGLIKANMPSRVAFAVSSGVDSRTILDMVGAEKLLGKGDMLFYPQGYTKPARIQGAFVSDKEVSDVVDFLKNQMIGNVYAEDVEEKIKSIGTVSGSGGGNADNRDEYFAEAGRFIIDKDKASIGMLQRVFKIGFNRAARIMDQLCEYGVVGEEEGTKPRKVLMSTEQFEQLLEEI